MIKLGGNIIDKTINPTIEKNIASLGKYAIIIPNIPKNISISRITNI
jgi:hypothetical protein